MKKRFAQGILFSLINSLSLGILGVVDKIGAKHFTTSIVFSVQSVTFSFLLVTFFALFYHKGSYGKSLEKISFSSWKNILFVGVLASGLFILFRFLGLTQSTGTFATLGQIVTTSETAILAMIFLKEKLSKPFWFLFIIILIAMYFVSVGNFTFTSLQKGDWYILLGATFVAFANIFAKFAVNKVNPVILSQGRFFFGAAFLILTSIFFFHQTNLLFTFSLWSLLSGFFWTINVLAFNFAIQRIGITFATALLMTAPVYTMVLEYFILKQSFNPVQIVAAVIVVASGTLMVVFKNK